MRSGTLRESPKPGVEIDDAAAPAAPGFVRNRVIFRVIFQKRLGSFRCILDHQHKRKRRCRLIQGKGLCLPWMLLSGLLLAAALAQAAIAPNPGGSEVVTNSTSSSYVTVQTPVTQQVNQYSTTLKAILNGSQTVFQQTYAVAFSDPAVQAAVSTADAILTGDNASPSAPAQTSTSTVLQSSQVSNGPIVQSTQATGNVSTTTVDTFGPATIMVGDNQSDTFTVLAGQLDINVNTNAEYYAYQNVTTTNTYLTTQSYTISGTAAAVSATPAPASWLLLVIGLGVAGLLTWLRRLRVPEA